MIQLIMLKNNDKYEMNKKDYFITALILILGLLGCSSSQPSNTLKEEQYEVINQNIKKSFSDDYSAINFLVVEEGFINNEETEYIVKFTFDLNKSYLIFDGKRIPGELKFSKTESEDWSCTYNSAGNALSLINLIRGK